MEDNGSLDKKEATTDCPRVNDLYKGKSIFVTGAAGFLGVVLLETLLRCCPGIQRIYILLRDKKGVSAKERFAQLFDRKIFTKVRNDDPGLLKKVQMIEGDISKPFLGICDEDIEMLTDTVSIIFHCASCVMFLRPLSYMVESNVAGTQNVLELCKKMKKMEAFVYTSTAYSNSNRFVEIEEIVYRLPYQAQRFLDEYHNGNYEVLEELAEECKPQWPNHYCFTKCITENLLIEQAAFPVAIIRPSIIACCWKGSMPGYAEEQSSVGQLALGVGKGFVKIAFGDPKIDVDIIPVDIVANAHILSAWHLATKRSTSPLVVNCTSYAYCRLSMREIIDSSWKYMKEHPIPMIMRTNPHCRVVNNRMMERMLALFEHYIPAYGIDMLLILQGKKPKLVSLYRFLDRVMDTGRYFALNQWKYKVDNFLSLEKSLCKEDKENFYTDATHLTYLDLVRKMQKNNPLYDWSIDKKSKEERLKIAQRVYIFSRFVQTVAALVIALFIYQIMSTFLRLGLNF